MSANDSLKKMLDNIINDNDTEAQTYFHEYLRDKMRNSVNEKKEKQEEQK